jgi:hypothetical protein
MAFAKRPIFPHQRHIEMGEACEQREPAPNDHEYTDLLHFLATARFDHRLKIVVHPAGDFVRLGCSGICAVRRLRCLGIAPLATAVGHPCQYSLEQKEANSLGIDAGCALAELGAHYDDARLLTK